MPPPCQTEIKQSFKQNYERPQISSYVNDNMKRIKTNETLLKTPSLREFLTLNSEITVQGERYRFLRVCTEGQYIGNLMGIGDEVIKGRCNLAICEKVMFNGEIDMKGVPINEKESIQTLNGHSSSVSSLHSNPFPSPSRLYCFVFQLSSQTTNFLTPSLHIIHKCPFMSLIQFYITKCPSSSLGQNNFKTLYNLIQSWFDEKTQTIELPQQVKSLREIEVDGGDMMEGDVFKYRFYKKEEMLMVRMMVFERVKSLFEMKIKDVQVNEKTTMMAQQSNQIRQQAIIPINQMHPQPHPQLQSLTITQPYTRNQSKPRQPRQSQVFSLLDKQSATQIDNQFGQQPSKDSMKNFSTKEALSFTNGDSMLPSQGMKNQPIFARQSNDRREKTAQIMVGQDENNKPASNDNNLHKVSNVSFQNMIIINDDNGNMNMMVDQGQEQQQIAIFEQEAMQYDLEIEMEREEQFDVIEQPIQKQQMSSQKKQQQKEMPTTINNYNNNSKFDGDSNMRSIQVNQGNQWQERHQLEQQIVPKRLEFGSISYEKNYQKDVKNKVIPQVEIVHEEEQQQRQNDLDNLVMVNDDDNDDDKEDDQKQFMVNQGQLTQMKGQIQQHHHHHMDEQEQEKQQQQERRLQQGYQSSSESEENEDQEQKSDYLYPRQQKQKVASSHHDKMYQKDKKRNQHDQQQYGYLPQIQKQQHQQQRQQQQQPQPQPSQPQPHQKISTLYQVIRTKKLPQQQPLLPQQSAQQHNDQHHHQQQQQLLQQLQHTEFQKTTVSLVKDKPQPQQPSVVCLQVIRQQGKIYQDVVPSVGKEGMEEEKEEKYEMKNDRNEKMMSEDRQGQDVNVKQNKQQQSQQQNIQQRHQHQQHQHDPVKLLSYNPLLLQSQTKINHLLLNQQQQPNLDITKQDLISYIHKIDKFDLSYDQSKVLLYSSYASIPNCNNNLVLEYDIASQQFTKLIKVPTAINEGNVHLKINQQGDDHSPMMMVDQQQRDSSAYPKLKQVKYLHNNDGKFVTMTSKQLCLIDNSLQSTRSSCYKVFAYQNLFAHRYKKELDYEMDCFQIDESGRFVVIGVDGRYVRVVDTERQRMGWTNEGQMMEESNRKKRDDKENVYESAAKAKGRLRKSKGDGNDGNRKNVVDSDEQEDNNNNNRKLASTKTKTKTITKQSTTTNEKPTNRSLTARQKVPTSYTTTTFQVYFMKALNSFDLQDQQLISQQTISIPIQASQVVSNNHSNNNRQSSSPSQSYLMVGSSLIPQKNNSKEKSPQQQQQLIKQERMMNEGQQQDRVRIETIRLIYSSSQQDNQNDTNPSNKGEKHLPLTKTVEYIYVQRSNSTSYLINCRQENKFGQEINCFGNKLRVNNRSLIKQLNSSGGHTGVNKIQGNDELRKVVMAALVV